jgi:CRP/FNR family cyclic AMP-dependent transcriptional regulator
VLQVPKGDILNGTRNRTDSDLDKLSRLGDLAWLSALELGRLAGALVPLNFKRSQVIYGEIAPADAHILLKGIARITCRNVRDERVTVALLPPGLIPEFPALPLSRMDFRCEAYSDCRAGSLSWHDFNRITLCNPEAMHQKVHASDLQQWYRVFLRSSGSLNLSLHERIAITLLELSANFGIEESRGMLLRASFSHQDIADLVGATRPRVTEHLAQLERNHLVIRQGRQLIICANDLAEAIGHPPSHESRPAAHTSENIPVLAAGNKRVSRTSNNNRSAADKLLGRA